tara:strand:- start:1373 stop:1564 length:192 start_codon:yes stop_codon:yes gene_type:complete
MTKKKTIEHTKPVIETIINSTALALTAFGTTLLLSKDYWGFLLIGFGVSLEFIKYLGRQKGLW